MQEVKLKEIETFHSPTYGILTFPEIIAKISYFTQSAPDHEYRIIIGTDSQSHGSTHSTSAQSRLEQGREATSSPQAGPRADFGRPGSAGPSKTSATGFVTALVVHRVGGGGIYFWKGYKKNRPYTLRERIYEEALASLEFANDFICRLKGEPQLLEVGLEIHVDIGENGATREMISEVVAMIKGNGYNVKTKPDSFGASKVADRHT
ncbi:MAG: ribonuclease H-like YkuK family protein [candidate division WWE3 bacterium]|nr:ribonuclease H-like YkuK family protein [candidate division WWE3 bacterium]